MAQDTNICYIFCAYQELKPGLRELFKSFSELTDSGRMEFTARIGYEFYYQTIEPESAEERKNNIENRLKVLGFSAGAHIGAFFCRYVSLFMSYEPGLLIGEYIFIKTDSKEC